MGRNTTNSHFYLPDYGAFGEAEKALYDAALDTLDATIASMKKNQDEGIIQRKTTAEIQVIASAGTSSDVRIFFNTTRNTLEMWLGFSFAKPL